MSVAPVGCIIVLQPYIQSASMLTMLCNTTLARMVVQALADGTGSHTKMGTWAVDEREAELCELIADQDERWDESMAGKEQWINIPAQPPGLFRSGTPQSTLKLLLPIH